jgi:hypothetical protein
MSHLIGHISSPLVEESYQRCVLSLQICDATETGTDIKEGKGAGTTIDSLHSRSDEDIAKPIAR